jgi:tRNA threonylcarbamoyladenosine biosynthesis protein TsaE
MSERAIELKLRDTGATEGLGTALAHAFVAAGRGAAVLHLRGELGAGKTTCVRSLLRALGVGGPIRSPTYTLIEVYALGARSCVHVDLYRLRGGTEVEDLGLRDYLDDESLLLVEWPEKGGTAVPPADLELALDYAEEARVGRLMARSRLGLRWLEKLGADTSLAAYVPNLT